MKFCGLRRAVKATCDDVVRHHTFQVAAALSYYFILATFPALAFLSVVLGSMPVPDLFAHILGLMARLLPQDAIDILRSVLASVFAASNHKTWIPVSIVTVVWLTSAAFDALIEALDIAYDVADPRPFWKTRLLAAVLGAVSGSLLVVAFSVMIVGPRFAAWLANRIDLSREFVFVWPFLHWTIATTFTVLAVEIMYFIAPNVKQRFVATLPGAVLTVGFWLGLSYLLGIYFRNFADYDRLYGTLGGFVAFMTWLYWNSFVLMVGAELNAEIAKESAKGAIQTRILREGDSLDHAA
ncbi:MAG: YihY/virulence factor BrkB family protein [Terriglobales bacterium]